MNKAGAAPRVRLFALVALLGSLQARADAVTEWNLQAGVILAEARPNPPVANRGDGHPADGCL